MTQERVQRRGAPGTPQQHAARQAASIRAGDRAAFRDLFLAYYDDLCRYACRYVGSLDVAEDLVQDVFFDLWNRRTTWRPLHSPKAFLYGAVRHQMFNHRRRASRHAGAHGVPGGLLSLEDPEQAFRYEELSRVTAQAVAELPPRCRDVFILSRQHELTYAEIAAVLGLSVKTVESHMGRALHHLRNRLSSLRQ